jgi:glycosyltransferase involved in cell wall biosynthesis
MQQGQLPLVSVLIIFYNQEKFVQETLDSVLAQDYGAIEIIAADDASTDGTQQIIKTYAAAHANIKPVLSAVNGGITQNCNNALQAATGRFVILFGGDDLMMPGRISRQVQYFQQNPETSVCCSDIEIFFDDAPHKNFVYRNREFYKKMSAARIIAQDNAPPTSALMFDYDKCRGIRFDERTPVVSDWLFVAEGCIRGKTGYINDVLTRYRRHSGNTTSFGIEKSYIQDRLIYTDILISRYPQFKLAYKKQRCSIFYNVGKRFFMAADFKGCRNILRIAWLEWPFSARVYALYMASFAGRLLLARIQKQKQG